MESVDIFCQIDENNFETLQCSKNRLYKFTQSFLDDVPPIFPANKREVLLFLNFLDTHELPKMKLDQKQEKEDVMKLLDIAQFCRLKKKEIPGQDFLIDMIYENLEDEFGVKFSCISDFSNEAQLDIYDYDVCKLIINKWRVFLPYNLFINDLTHKRKMVDCILDGFSQVNKNTDVNHNTSEKTVKEIDKYINKNKVLVSGNNKIIDQNRSKKV